MASLEYSNHLKRMIRSDSWDTIGIPTWTVAEEAMRAGRIDEGVALYESARYGLNFVRNEFVGLFVKALDRLVEFGGEEEVERFWRDLGQNLPLRHNLTPQGVIESVRVDTEVQRAHSCGATGKGDLKVVEEKDRFVVIADPCGSGGVMRRKGMGGVTSKAYPWSWGKAGVTYHCTHCAIWWEMMAIEDRGYPLKVVDNVDKLDEPCVHYYYKSPELIPEEYFTRVGKKKDPSKFKL